MEAERVLKRWKKLMKPLKADLNQLVDHYLTTGTRNRYGLCVKNAVGQSFNCTYKKSGNGENGSPSKCAASYFLICYRGWKVRLFMIMLLAIMEFVRWSMMGLFLMKR